MFSYSVIYEFIESVHLLTNFFSFIYPLPDIVYNVFWWDVKPYSTPPNYLLMHSPDGAT